MISQVVAYALLSLAPAQDAGAARPLEIAELPVVAERAEDVRPLLPGSEIPAVQVALPDGKPLDVAKFTAESPTILIFYRGGW